MLPHIVFNPSAAPNSYFPGPEFWQSQSPECLDEGSPTAVNTSGIINPPVHAIAARLLFERAMDRDAAEAFLRDMYPRLQRWMDYLYRERDPDGNSLVYVRHPWESGMDNSPVWDEPYTRIPFHRADIKPYVRRDIHKGVDPRDRPSNATYDKFVWLATNSRNHSYNEASVWNDLLANGTRKHTFFIEDVLFNAVLARAADDMAELATRLNNATESARWQNHSAATLAAIKTNLWSDEHQIFLDRDQVTEQLIPERIATGLAPLFAGDLANDTLLEALLRTMNSTSFCGMAGPAAPTPGCVFPVPTCDTQSAKFDRRLYWKGPAWINTNWIIHSGLVANNLGGSALAKRIKAAVRSFVTLNNDEFHEYFDVFTGEAHGTGGFSWSAALFIDLFTAH